MQNTQFCTRGFIYYYIQMEYFFLPYKNILSQLIYVMQRFHIDLKIKTII